MIQQSDNNDDSLSALNPEQYEYILRSNEQLMDQFNELVGKLQDKTWEIKLLKDEMAEQKDSFLKEMDKNYRMVNLLNNKIKHLQRSTLPKNNDETFQNDDGDNDDENKLNISGLDYKRMNDRLKHQLTQMVNEFETKLPLLETLDKNNRDLKDKLIVNIEELDSLSIENANLRKENTNVAKRLDVASKKIDKLLTQRTDLSNQINYLLHQKIEDSSRDQLSDSQQVISSQLLAFDDVSQLQLQNMKLLAAIRELANKFETPTETSESISQGVALQNQIVTLKQRIDTLTLENDSYKLLIDDDELIKNQKEDKVTISKLKDELSATKEDSNVKLTKLQHILRQKELQLIAKDDSIKSLAENKENIDKSTKELYEMNSSLRNEIQKSNSDNRLLESQLTKEREQNYSFIRKIQTIKSEFDSSNNLVKFLTEKNLILEETIKTIKQDNTDLREKLDKFTESKFVATMQTPIISNSPLNQNEQTEKFRQKINQLETEIQQRECNFKKITDQMNSEVVWLQKQLSNTGVDLSHYNSDSITSSNLLGSHMNIATDLSETINNDNMTIIKLQHEKNTAERTVTTLKMELNLLKGQMQIIQNEKSESASSIPDDDVRKEKTITGKYSKIVDEVTDKNILNGKLSSLTEQLHTTMIQKSNLENDKQNIEKINESNVIKLQTYTDELNSSKQMIEMYKEEVSRWKGMVEQLSSKRPEELKQLTDEITKLKSDLHIAINTQNELDDKFNRLKRQAREKLEASKVLNSQLSANIEQLNSKRDALENQIKQFQEIETKHESEKNQLEIQLKETVEKLKSVESQPNTLNEDVEKKITEKINSVKEEYEQKRQELVEQITKEMQAKYEGKDIATVSTSDPDIEKLKEEWERETLVRIEDAKEDLKKHIRLPSEEKIKKVIDKRRAKLEGEFDQRIQEKAQALKLSETLNKPADEIEKELETKIKNRLEEEFNNTLKKKAFNEGKLQAAMRVTLLERKISKLEAQSENKDNTSTLKDVSTVSSRKSVSGLSKIDISNPFSTNNAMLNTSNKTLSNISKEDNVFSPLPNKVNPFSSNNSPMKESPMSAFKSIFGSHMKPTFGSLSPSHTVGSSSFGLITSRNKSNTIPSNSTTTLTNANGLDDSASKRKSPDDDSLMDHAEMKKLKPLE